MAPTPPTPTISFGHIQLTDFVGDHGAYQLSITALLFVRYVLLGLMANSGPLMTPDVTFYCSLPRQEILLLMPNISALAPQDQELEIREEFKQICQIDLHLYKNLSQLSKATTKSQAKSTPLIVSAGQQKQQLAGGPPAGLDSATGHEMARTRECTDFTYQVAEDQGLTMTSQFDLVCDRDWLRSLFQSLLSASIVVAHVFWGTFSDKYGRFQAQRICLVVSLFAGVSSIFAPDFWTFTLARALCSFGDLGMVVSLTTTVVELVGSNYRGLSVALVNFGYALGVSLLPYVVAYFENFRLVVGFTVLCHMVTMPFVLATNESVRWLLTNRKFEQARRELRRISSWNQSFKGRKSCEAASAHLVSLNGAQGRKRRRRRQRQVFEVMFKEFVRQIESQNLCDPIATATDERPEVPELSVADPNGRSAGSFAAAAAPSDSTANKAHGNHQFQVHLNLGPSTEVKPNLMHATANKSTPALEGAQMVAGGHQQPRRALSCGQISDKLLGEWRESSAAGKAGDDHADEAERELARPGPRRSLLDSKLKTLTLPHVSRDSTTCADDSHDDRYLTHTIGQRLASGGARHRQQPDCINLVAHQLSFVGRVSRLFKDKKMMIAVFTIVWTTFNSELLYTSFIIINLEVGEDVYLNYILGGCMEALAAISASLLLSYSPRRVSLIAFWLLISFSCFGLSLAHIDSTWAVWMLALAKFSQSSLSSIASVAAYESFPTFLRQSGSGLVFTLGMLGSVFAPLIFAEFDDHAEMDRVLMTFSVSSLSAAILIYLFLNETRNCELM